MIRPALILIASLSLTGAMAIGEERVPLLNVSKGQIPNDTSQDDKTLLSIETNTQLGGKALKVVYAQGDAFGMSRGTGVTDWNDFVALEFSVFNPQQTNISLNLAVKHRRTTSFQTQVEIPLMVKPGRNDFRLGIHEMTNVNGSSPDLTAISHWYVHCSSGTPTLYFSDFWLTGGQAATVGPNGAPSIPLAGKYKVTGKIGELDVNLTIEPINELGSSLSDASPKPTADSSDPKRLARIRSAKMPPITKPIEFYTPQADAILAALEVFPPDNAFNQTVDTWPLHPNSKSIVASIGVDKPLRYNPDMGFILVPPNQPRVAVKIVDYPGESDRGPFPVAANVPIEGWPVIYQRGNTTAKSPTLAQVQSRPDKYEGDRHAIIVDPVNRKLYEFFTFGKTPNGWTAGQASVFDLSSNQLRPEGWTSADAAGLPIFPAVVRYDELQRGVIDHAMRVTVRRSRRAYLHPATHYASRLDDENLPRMGERLRLRADFDTSEFSAPVKTILEGLKRYGMLVADNGIEWAISVTPDPRIPVLHDELRKIRGADFEVVVAPE